jgi:hypothetical protein
VTLNFSWKTFTWQRKKTQACITQSKESNHLDAMNENFHFASEKLKLILAEINEHENC